MSDESGIGPQESRPQTGRLGWLKNGNPPCDLSSLPRCQATSKSTGKRCGNVTVKGKRVCYIHGGKSTGPRTPEGLERCRKSNWKIGFYSAEMIAERREVRRIIKESKAMVKRLREGG